MILLISIIPATKEIIKEILISRVVISKNKNKINKWMVVCMKEKIIVRVEVQVKVGAEAKIEKDPHIHLELLAGEVH